MLIFFYLHSQLNFLFLPGVSVVDVVVVEI